jgi:hypothetical protein
MTEAVQEQPAAEQATKKYTPEQARAELVKTFTPYAPSIMQVVALYRKQYPPETTPAEVLDAVTVPVPLRAFFVLASIAFNELRGAGAFAQAEKEGGKG